MFYWRKNPHKFPIVKVESYRHLNLENLEQYSLFTLWEIESNLRKLSKGKNWSDSLDFSYMGSSFYETIIENFRNELAKGDYNYQYLLRTITGGFIDVLFFYIYSQYADEKRLKHILNLQMFKGKNEDIIEFFFQNGFFENTISLTESFEIVYKCVLELEKKDQPSCPFFPSQIKNLILERFWKISEIFFKSISKKLKKNLRIYIINSKSEDEEIRKEALIALFYLGELQSFKDGKYDNLIK